MKELPILFSAPMIKAVLADQKVVTRRALKISVPHRANVENDPPRYCLGEHDKCDACEWVYLPTRRIAAGDRLWVREAWAAWFRDDVAGQFDWKGTAKARRTEKNCIGIAYRATAHDCLSIERWVAPLFMPRWASRLSLDVASVRVERLHDITDAEATLEGVRPLWLQEDEPPGCWYTGDPSRGATMHARTPRGAFEKLWVAINGRESWDANPLVWRVEFAREVG